MQFFFKSMDYLFIVFKPFTVLGNKQKKILLQFELFILFLLILASLHFQLSPPSSSTVFYPQK